MSRRSLILAGFVALLVALPFMVGQFSVTILNYIGLSAIVAVGLVLLTGIAGLTSFGQAAFVGLGAYTSAYLSTAFGLSPWLTLIAGLVLTWLVAASIGFITLRLSSHYFPLATIAWGISLYYLFGNLESLGGHSGINDIPKLDLFGMKLADTRIYYFLIWFVVIAGAISIRNLLDSRSGRAIRSLRSASVMAEAFGVDTARLKIVVFIYAALLAAISGWLYAHLLQFVNPTPFNVGAGVQYLFMVVIGGAKSVWGAIVGAALTTVALDWLQDILPKLLGKSGNYETVVFGVLIVVLLHRARSGLAPFIERRIGGKAAITMPLSATPLAARADIASQGALLDVREATKRFGGLVAVNAVSFSMQKGEILGLIGPNGAGKSTLFNLITGVSHASSGEVHFCGARIDGKPSREITALGMVRTFQHVKLVGSMSVIENVAVGAHLRGSRGVTASALRLDRAEEASLLDEARRQLERVGLGDLLHARAGSLALGQQRIVEVARALAADPVLLLLDEPAAGLRYGEKQALAELLRSLRAQGISILLVEHDMDFVMNLVDRLVVVDFGHKIAEGKPADVQANPAVLEAYLGGLDD